MLKKRFPILDHFTHNEFDSPDLFNSGLLMDIDFILLLHEARKIAKVPFIITSGYRTKHHNSIIGGVSNSSHLKGLAVDIKCNNSANRYIILQSLLRVGINRIGINNTFIHADVDLSKKNNVVWLYN